MQVYVNGENKELPIKMKLSGVLDHFAMPSERIAIELNKEVVRRKDWADIEVKDGDRLEIIHFVGGG